MISHRRTIAVMALLLAVADSRAQFYGPPPYGRGGIAIYGSYGKGPRLSIVGLLPIAGPYYYPPDLIYGSGYSSFRQTTIILTPPPIIVIRDGRPTMPDGLEATPPPSQRRTAPKEWVADVPERVRPLPPPPERKPAEKLPAPSKPDPLFNRPPEPARLPPPVETPTAASARLIESGRLAFGAGEYGTARERFRLALNWTPNQPLAHFLLAQSLIAVGKYPEAIESIHQGLPLNPDWPKSTYRPIALYVDKEEEYTAHARRLASALERHPDEPLLLFLSGYQMWFDGRKDEARALFRRALARGADRADVERFLRVDDPKDL